MANAFLKECFHSNKNGEIQRNIHGSCSRRICQTCAIGDLVIMRPESTFHHCKTVIINVDIYTCMKYEL